MIKKKNKIKITLIVSIISILIALSSLSYSIYKDFRDLQLSKDIKALETRGATLEESYTKISLAEKNLMDNINNCEKINKEKVKANLKRISDARSATINNDNEKALQLISQIDDVCIGEVGLFNDNTQNMILFSIVMIVWILLVIGFFRISNKV